MQATLTKSISIAGVQFSENTIVNSSNNVVVDPAIPVAQPATLTTRTSGTAGTLTMTNVGHGIVTGQRLDLYFSGGQIRGATVGTVAGSSVPFSGGTFSGGLTVLPIATSPMVAATPIFRPLAVVGNTIDILAVYGPAGGHSLITIVDAGLAELTFFHNQGGVVQTYYPVLTDTNLLAGDTVGGVYLSHDNVVGVQQVLVGVMSS